MPEPFSSAEKDFIPDFLSYIFRNQLNHVENRN